MWFTDLQNRRKVLQYSFLSIEQQAEQSQMYYATQRNLSSLLKQVTKHKKFMQQIWIMK